MQSRSIPTPLLGVNWQFRRQEPKSLLGVNWQISLLLVVSLTLSLFLLITQPIQAGSFFGHVHPQLLQMAQYAPDQTVNVIVQKAVTGSAPEEQVTQLGGQVTEDLGIIHGFAANLSAAAAVKLSQNPAVRWISPDAPAVSQAKPCPECIDSTSLKNNYVQTVKANQVWNKNRGVNYSPWLQGNGIGIAVVDSGINARSGDFGANGARVTAQVNFASGATTTEDRNGHGTFVAGIIGGDGAGSNGTYIGVAPKANLISVKVSADNGAAATSDMIKGLQWILNNKDTYNIRVVNISMNSSVRQSYNVDPLCAAVEILWFNGIVVVVSAGNNGNNGLLPPANDPFVITVGAVDEKGSTSPNSDSVAAFSSYGKDETGGLKPDLVAPGVDLIATLAGSDTRFAKEHSNKLVNNSYFKMSGTSAATPVVAGAVALLLQSEPYLNPDQVKYRLKYTALQNKSRFKQDRRATWPQYNATTAGAGLLDVNQAVTTGTSTTANTGLPASHLLWTGNNPVAWGSVNWSSVNWSSVNWSSVNWSSVNWSSVNWSTAYWDD